MRSPIMNLMAAITLACGTLVCAAETQPAQAPVEANVRAAVEQLDSLVAAKLEPTADGTLRLTQAADGVIHLHARVRPTQPQAATEQPATQPARDLQFEIDIDGADARRLDGVRQSQVDIDVRKEANQKLEDQVRLWEDTARQLAVVNEHAGTDGAYLGIGVDAPNETLRAQLGLAPGAGLVINFVDENGPAKAAVQPHDVLQKLDDQLLINGDQLVALVRMRKPGETISLTLLRRARPVTVQVELGQRKPIKAENQSSSGKADGQPILPNYIWSVSPTTAHLSGTFSTPNYGLFTSGGNFQTLSSGYTVSSNPNDLASYLQPHARVEQRPITFNDGELLATFGKGELLAVDLKDGKVIYHGPIGNQSQWNAMPKLLQDKLGAWRSLVCPPETRPAAVGTPEPDRK